MRKEGIQTRKRRPKGPKLLHNGRCQICKTSFNRVLQFQIAEPTFYGIE